MPDNLPPEPEVGFVLSHGGSRGRMGATFQYPYYAKRLAEHGCPSLRFDPSGVGDSTGPRGVHHIRDWHFALENGHWVDDTIAAANWFRREVRPRKLIIGGVCAGAVSALGAVASGCNADGIVVMGPPVLYTDDMNVVASGRQETESVRTGAEAKQYFRDQRRALLSLGPWLKLIRGRSNAMQLVRAIARSEVPRVVGHFPRPVRRLLRPYMPRHPRFNTFFLRSFEAVMRQRIPVLFVYGDRDPFWLGFQEHFQRIYWDDNPRYADLCRIETIVGSNHFFTLREWQAKAFDAIRAWLSTST